MHTVYVHPWAMILAHSHFLLNVGKGAMKHFYIKKPQT